ncbi:MAG: hypothetical protein ACYS0D_16325 [Planctomycetota bacterium]
MDARRRSRPGRHRTVAGPVRAGPQRFILETLYEDYQAEFDTGVDAFRDRVAEMREVIDPANPDPSQIMRVIFGTINEWRAESKILGEQFVSDLKGLLNEAQMQTWPPFERKIFRLKYMRNGQLPSENLDLTVHVQDLDLTPVQLEEIRSLMLQYEEALHEALRRREDYLQSSQNDLIAAIQNNEFQVGIDVAERQVVLRKAVRDVNEQYTVALAAALPEDIGKDFLNRVRQATYPRVYGMVPAQRVFTAAKELDGISKETLQAIVTMEQDFLRELQAFNEALMQLVRNYEPKKIKNKVAQATSRLSGETPPALQDPTREQYAERREISNRYMDSLKSVLTSEQFASLPGARRWLTPDERGALGQSPGTKSFPRPRQAPGVGDETAPAGFRSKGSRQREAYAEDEGKHREAPKD